MRKVTHFAGFWSSILICIYVCLGSGNANVGKNYKTSLDGWATERYFGVLELVLPLAKTQVTRLPENIRWAAVGRIVDPEYESEMKLDVQRTYGNEIIVQFRIPSPPLLQQLQKLKQKHHNAANADLATAISVTQHILRGAECQKLNTWALKFERLNASPILPDELILHSALYQMWVGSQYGNISYLEYHGAGPQDPVQPHPVITWMEESRELVEFCIRK